MNFTDPENRADDYKTAQVPVNIDSVLSSNDIQEVVKNDKIEYIQPTSSNQTEEPGKVNYTIIHTFQLIHILMMTCLYHTEMLDLENGEYVHKSIRLFKN